MLNKYFILILSISLLLVFSSCKKYKEEAPFFDGLILEYDLGGPFKWIYNISSLNDSSFKIIETHRQGALGDDVEELYVDQYGRVYKSSYKDYKGKFSPIWIPAHKMEIGDTFDGGYSVVRKEKWKHWDVLVVKDPDVNQERYFDLNTGYWVGLFGKGPRGPVTIVLVNTNANIPTVEE